MVNTDRHENEPPHPLERAGGWPATGRTDMMQAIRGTLAAWWARNVIASDPQDTSRLDAWDRPTRAEARRILTGDDPLTDEQIDRLCQVLAAEVSR